MATNIGSALACAFAWTAAASDAKVTFAPGTSPVQAPVPTATYRTGLAPAASDFARVWLGVLNAAMVSAGRAGVFSLMWGADGRYTLSCTEAFTLAASAGSQALGWTAGASVGTSTTADYSPMHVLLLGERRSGMWGQITPIAAGETLGGVGYGVTSGVTRWEDEFDFGFVTRDASITGEYVTPWEPAEASLGSLGAAHLPWSISDTLAVALGQTCALARGRFQAIRASTSVRYDLVTIPGKEIASPRVRYQLPPWEKFLRWQVRLIRQSGTPTGTRA